MTHRDTDLGTPPPETIMRIAKLIQSTNPTWPTEFCWTLACRWYASPDRQGLALYVPEADEERRNTP